MNGRERVLTALAGGQSDRVPLLELHISSQVLSRLGIGTYLDAVEFLDLDGVVVNEVRDAENITWLDQRKKVFRDCWGTVWQYTAEAFPVPIRFPLTGEADVAHYRPPNPTTGDGLAVLREVVRRFRGRRAIMWQGPTDYFASCYLRGMENLLMDYALNPKLAHVIADLRQDYTLARHQDLLKEEGVDIIAPGDDYAYHSATMMSPTQFRTFILPYFRDVVANAHDHGGRVLKHTDGNIWDIIGDLVDTGVDGLGPLEPEAGMDLARVKQHYPVAVMGNVGVQLLCRGTVEEVKAETRRLLHQVSPGGGHIMSSGNSISASVKPENFQAMVTTTREEGWY